MNTMRQARPDEADAIHELVNRAYAPYVPIIGRRPTTMDDDYAARIAAGEANVLERDGTVVALAVLQCRPDHLWIDNLAVDPTLHGQGIGQALLAFAEAEARRLGLRELRLLTNERMTRNRALYAEAGFRETEIREEDGRRRVYMARRLEG